MDNKAKDSIGQKNLGMSLDENSDKENLGTSAGDEEPWPAVIEFNNGEFHFSSLVMLFSTLQSCIHMDPVTGEIKDQQAGESKAPVRV